MNIFITGGSGFVGRYLCHSFLEKGHQVTAIGRSSHQSVINHQNYNYVSADTTQPGKWQKTLPDQDIIINLAGRSIFTYWTEKIKDEIYNSRIITTRNLVDALPENNKITLLSTSAIGYYGDRGEDLLTEREPHGEDFLARTAHDWEAEALIAEFKGTRVVLPRFGIVLDQKGGAMAKMIPAFRMFVGGRIGSGNQWFPWIHMHDLVRAFNFLIDDKAITGPVNFCAPEPVRNAALVKTLGDKLHRPAKLKAPAVLVKSVVGEFGESLLNSQRAIPEKLAAYGFEFRYSDIEAALAEIVRD